MGECTWHLAVGGLLNEADEYRAYKALPHLRVHYTNTVLHQIKTARQVNSIIVLPLAHCLRNTMIMENFI